MKSEWKKNERKYLKEPAVLPFLIVSHLVTYPCSVFPLVFVARVEGVGANHLSLQLVCILAEV